MQTFFKTHNLNYIYSDSKYYNLLFIIKKFVNASVLLQILLLNLLYNLVLNILPNYIINNLLPWKYIYRLFLLDINIDIVKYNPITVAIKNPIIPKRANPFMLGPVFVVIIIDDPTIVDDNIRLTASLLVILFISFSRFVNFISSIVNLTSFFLGVSKEALSALV